jgi:hypothetical protein
MNISIAQCRYLLSLADPILAGLDDSHRAIEPRLGTKTAGWLIGHLAVTGDVARRLCGRSPICPKEWRSKFNPDTQPSSNPDEYPPMDQLRQVFHAVYDDLCIAATVADAATLEADNPFAPARDAFPTVGEFVAYLLTGHLGYHLGQLVAWRASAGLGRLLRPDADVA